MKRQRREMKTESSRDDFSPHFSRTHVYVCVFRATISAQEAIRSGRV